MKQWLLGAVALGLQAQASYGLRAGDKVSAAAEILFRGLRANPPKPTAVPARRASLLRQFPTTPLPGFTTTSGGLQVGTTPPPGVGLQPLTPQEAQYDADGDGALSAAEQAAYEAGVSAPAGAPGPAPGPAPAPITAPPPPPCNWTKDDQDVARPANCVTLASGNVTCEVADEWPPEEICKKPLLVNCPEIPNLAMNKDNYLIYADKEGVLSDMKVGVPHGTRLNISCVGDLSAPTDRQYPVKTWGTEYYMGPTEANTTCNNGTWRLIASQSGTLLKPQWLNCFLREQISLLKTMIYLDKWTRKKLNETNNVTDKEGKHYPWKDSSASQRMATLVNAQTNAVRMVGEALDAQMPSVADFKNVIFHLKDAAMISRGTPFSQDTCTDLQNHWLYQLPGNQGGKGAANFVPTQYPVSAEMGYPTDEVVTPMLDPAISLKCLYTVQKAQIGYDYMTATPVMYYREGCYCESRWTGGCPFRLELSPSYKYFGFTDFSERVVSRGMGSHSPNALCWYWSTPTHPEWGYLYGVGHGTAYQAPELNSTQLTDAWVKLKMAEEEKAMAK